MTEQDIAASDKVALLFEPALWADMNRRSILLNARAGDIIMQIGQRVTSVPIVLQGTFKITRVNDEGQEILLYYVKPGDGCAMMFTCWMTTKVSAVKVVAEEEAVLMCFPVAVADEWMTGYPTWRKFVMTTILDGFTEVIRSIDDVAFKKMDVRLANYLREKSAITGSRLINLSHQQISGDLGTSRVVVSRLLKSLEHDKKLLLYRNQIRLLKDL